MAGNIIPAIATTNAIIAALIVMEGLKILAGEFDKCRNVFLTRQPNFRKRILVPCSLNPPNPKCYVCCEKPEVVVKLNPKHITVKTLEEKVCILISVDMLKSFSSIYNIIRFSKGA
jgi:ubiquitin-like 1-activating enzyme E1 B